MAILEGLGPRRKVFEDLTPGDYTFEITGPGDKGWIYEKVDEDNPQAEARYINWKLTVIHPETYEGKPFFYMTMFYATPEKIAKAKRPYDPAGFTYQFLGKIGAGVIIDGDVVVKDEYITDGQLDIDKLIGFRFEGSIREEKDKSGTLRTQLVKVWPV